MNKSILFSGIISANLFAWGCIFKVFYWTGANIMITSAIVLCCAVFLPLALIRSNRESEGRQWLLHVLAAVVFVPGLLSILFQVLHLPGAGFVLRASLPLPFVIFLPAYLYQTRQKNNEPEPRLFAVMFGLCFLAVFSVMLAG